MNLFRRAAKAVAHPNLEARLRAGKFEGLDPKKVEEFLGPTPVHFYDICAQPEWVKRARQWAYEAKLPPAVYPIHYWSAGLGGDVRSPLTWFVCGRGHTTLGSPHALPDDPCFTCTIGREDPGEWKPMDSDEAGNALRSLEGEAFTRRVETPPARTGGAS